MTHNTRRLMTALAAVFVLQCTVCRADSVASRWSKLRKKIDYGKSGEFEGTVEEGRAILAELKKLLKESKRGSGVYKQINREVHKLSKALTKNKMAMSVDKEEQSLENGYEQALACQEKVKSLEATAQQEGRLLTPAEMDTIDQQWGSCLKLVKRLKTTIIRLRKNCHRLKGDYHKKWDDYEKKIDRLRDIAMQARDDLRRRRKAKR